MAGVVPIHSTRPEEAAIVACARLAMDPEGPRALPELAAVVNWDFLFNHAADHGVLPRLGHALSHGNSLCVPSAFRSRCEIAWRAQATRNLELSGALLKVLDLLSANDVEALPFRGPVLASTLYGDRSLRDFRDLDILVRRRDAERATQLLVAGGYRPICHPAERHGRRTLRARNELHFQAPTASFQIEIHQSFLRIHQFPLENGALWDRLCHCRWQGRDILALDPEDLLLLLSAHGAKHRWSRLGWVCDIARLLRVFENDLNWGRVLGRSDALGARRLVALSLLLAMDVLDAPAPEDMVVWARNDAQAARLARRVAASWFDPRRHAGPFDGHIFFIRARERTADKLRYGFSLLFTPTEQDYLTCALPAFLSALYHPVHAVRVIGKYGLDSVRTRW